MPSEGRTTEDQSQGGVTEGSPRPAGVQAAAVSDLSVFVVDDHQVVLDAVAAVIEATPGLAVAGSSMSGTEALAQLEARTDTPVLLVDVNLGEEDGVEIARRYVTEQHGTAVLMSARREIDLPGDWRSAGASAFVPKDQIGSGRLRSALIAAAQSAGAR